jgi:hypothetical protein
MKNMDISIMDDILTIRIDLTQEHGASRAGRSTVIASSGGNLRLFDANGFREEILNMSVCKRKPWESGCRVKNFFS